MPTPPTPASKQNGTSTIQDTGLNRLRAKENPFSFSVATAGTQAFCLTYDIPELLDSQRADLFGIVNLYRKQDRPSQVFPILGDSGTGKTHLLTTLQDELQREAVNSGNETLFLVADHFSVGVDAVDFFFWQIINHLLSSKEPGARLLQVISKRVTARLLAEALRQLPPHRQVQLIPVRSAWERVKTWFGSSAVAQTRLDRVRDLIARCDVPTSVEPCVACEETGLPLGDAVALINAHLQRTEPNDANGSLRRDLYSRLANFALRNEVDGLKDYLNDGFREGPSLVKGAGQLTRRMLTVLLELFRALNVPVIVVFDQLEDYLRGSSPVPEQQLRDTFRQALAALVNNVSGLGLLVFAEQGLWNSVILAQGQQYANARLDQEFSLPGRPALRAVLMPDRVPQKYLGQLIERRVRAALGADFDTTGLPPYFPFTEDQLRELETEPTIRGCLRRLSRWFNEAVFATPSPLIPQPLDRASQLPDVEEKLKEQLRKRWDTEMAGAQRIIQGDDPRPSLIPKVQNALFYWLLHLKEQGVSPAATWAKVELIEDASKGPYGYLTVIRPKDPNAPGVGIATWLAQARGRPNELRYRLGFFDNVPCPIRTLALFREDGKAALTGETQDVYDEAVKKGRDVRIQSYKSDDVASLLAFPNWVPSVAPDVQSAGPNGAVIFKEFIAKLSQTLLGWIVPWL